MHFQWWVFRASASIKLVSSDFSICWLCFACKWKVALESIRIHTAINDGILNLVDKVRSLANLKKWSCVFLVCLSLLTSSAQMQFFEMQRDDAIRALDIFKRAINQVNTFSIICQLITLLIWIGFVQRLNLQAKWLNHPRVSMYLSSFLGCAGRSTFRILRGV